MLIYSKFINKKDFWSTSHQEGEPREEKRKRERSQKGGGKKGQTETILKKKENIFLKSTYEQDQ